MKPDPDIVQAVDGIQVIDTHEHQEEEAQRLERKLDFFSLFEHYSVSDLVSAGMSDESVRKCESADTPVDEKWRLFEPHFLPAHNTGYLRAACIAARDLYGIEELNAGTYAALTDRLRERNKPGVVRWILRDRCQIRVAQVNALKGFFRMETDAGLFQQDLSLAALLNWPPPVEALSKVTGLSITAFKAYGEAIDKLFATYAPLADAMKQQSAYWRMQNFAKVDDADAERVFEEALKDAGQVPEARRHMLQDWAFHRCIRLCIDHDLPIKIHTGYAAGHNGMWIDNLKPNPLSNLFIWYPKARFDLFHIGYPYQAEVIALAKHFRNVYVDMCWAWIIDPDASCRFLKQFLTAVPANKVFAFGGDYGSADPVYGHLRIARDGVARALTELVADDYLTRDQAIAVAHRVLHDNAAVFFRVDQKVEALQRAQQRKPA